MPASPSPAAAFRPCVIVPVYGHDATLARLAQRLAPLGLPCWFVDDGNPPAVAATIAQLAREHARWLTHLRLPHNQGKGAAVAAGWHAAFAAGCTHAVQIDADLQHDPDEIPRFIAAARARPEAIVNGVPQYDASVPAVRLHGRKITTVLVWLHTLSRQIGDAMCGFRLYPLAATVALDRQHPVGRRMEFDADVIVRLFWAGTPVVNLPTPVTYPADGVSNFRMVRDNLRMAALHLRLLAGMLLRLPVLLPRRLTGRAP